MFLSLTNVKISNKDFNWKKTKKKPNTRTLHYLIFKPLALHLFKFPKCSQRLNIHKNITKLINSITTENEPTLYSNNSRSRLFRNGFSKNDSNDSSELDYETERKVT